MRTLTIMVLLLSFHTASSLSVVTDTVVARTYLEKAREFINVGLYDSSFHYYSQGARIYKKADHQEGYARAMYGQGLALHYQVKSKEALPYYLASLSILEKLHAENDPFISDLNSNIGGCYIDLGRRALARSYLEKGLNGRLHLYGKNHRLSASSYYNLGLSSMYFGEYNKALSQFMEALPVYLNEYGENGARVAQLYTNVGILHRDLGDYQTAEDYFQRGITIHKTNHGDTYWNLAYPYSNLGEVYENTGQDSLAETYYKKALVLTENGDRDLIRLQSILLAMLGKFYGKRGQYDLGLSYLDEATRIMQQNFFDDHPKLNDFYRIKGSIYKRKKEYTEALSWYELAADNVIRNYGSTHPHLAMAYLETSEVYLEMKQYDDALEFIEKGINALKTKYTVDGGPLAEVILDERQLLGLLSMRGRIYFSKALESGKDRYTLVQALESYRMAAETIDDLRRGYISESSKLFLQENSQNIYEQALEISHLLYQLSQDDSYLAIAFEIMEKNKAVILSETLQLLDLKELPGIPSSVISAEKEWKHKLKSAEMALIENQDNREDSLRSVRINEVFKIKRHIDSLTIAIEKSYPGYHQLKYDMDVASLADIQATLDNETLVLTIFQGDSTWFFMYVTADKATLDKVPHDKMSTSFLKLLWEQMSRSTSDIKLLTENSYTLYNLLLSDQLENNKFKKVIIVPDGVLGYIPFDALATKPFTTAAPGPSYLLEKVALSYGNSMTLLSKNRHPNKELSYAGFASSYKNNPTLVSDNRPRNNFPSQLSGTLEEVTNASALFTGKAFLEENASEYNFKNNLDSPAILHLALHANLHDKEAMRSGFIFSSEKDTIEDGLLNAYEIYSLQIPADLAVLSACHTGIGEIRRGEGIMSLSRAFMYAGCPNIVMSLWRAGDQSTSQIVTEFFQNLHQEYTKDEALRQAKLEYLAAADPFKAHPAHWAGLVFVGNPSSIQGENHNPLYLILLPVALLALGLLTFLMINKRVKTIKPRFS